MSEQSEIWDCVVFPESREQTVHGIERVLGGMVYTKCGLQGVKTELEYIQPGYQYTDTRPYCANCRRVEDAS